MLRTQETRRTPKRDGSPRVCAAFTVAGVAEFLVYTMPVRGAFGVYQYMSYRLYSLQPRHLKMVMWLTNVLLVVGGRGLTPVVTD